MRMLPRLLLAFAALLSGAVAAATPYRMAPVPGWVKAEPLPNAADALPTSDGTRYLLLDDQVDARGAAPVWFRRIATRLEQARALSDGGQIRIGFQPDYQRVEIHAIRVWRDGVASDRRAQARIEVLRREEDLDAAIFDGEHTLSLTVPDLRVGDIVDYSFSIIGDNPVFGDAYYDSYTARFGPALGYRRVRVRFDPARPLQARAPDGFQRHEAEDGGARVLEFVQRRVPRTRTEPDAPGSFDPYGRIELSTAAGWGDIVRWARPMYLPRLRDRAMAMTLVNNLRLHDPDRQAAMLRAIAFVEGEIRYTALDMGKNSHEPNAPETVVTRRFGDCKDKAVLLSALLHEAGIDAEPVLVDTVGRETLASRLPSAVAFDHVVVRAHLDGKAVWVDPTRDVESGPLEERTPLPFRLGLPLCAGCDRLVAMPLAPPRVPQVDVGQHVELSEQPGGYDAAFTVVTDYRNERADSVRDDFADDREEVASRYLSYMRKYYAGMRSIATPSLGGRGRGQPGVRAIERYALHWPRKDGNTFDIVLFQLLDWLPDPELDARRTPLDLGGPLFARQVIRTHLAGGWDIAPERSTVANPWFDFRRIVRVRGDVLEVTGEWRRLADQVPASGYARFRADAGRVRELMDYGVSLGAPGAGNAGAAPAGDGWRAAACVLLLLVLLLGWHVFLQERELRVLRASRISSSPSA